MAAKIGSEAIRKDMEEVARQYDLMADNIEEVEKKKLGEGCLIAKEKPRRSGAEL